MILIQDGSQNTNVDKPLRIIGDPYKVQVSTPWGGGRGSGAAWAGGQGQQPRVCIPLERYMNSRS